MAQFRLKSEKSRNFLKQRTTEKPGQSPLLSGNGRVKMLSISENAFHFFPRGVKHDGKNHLPSRA